MHFGLPTHLLVYMHHTVRDLERIGRYFERKSLKKQQNSLQGIELQQKHSVDTSSRNEVWFVVR